MSRNLHAFTLFVVLVTVLVATAVVRTQSTWSVRRDAANEPGAYSAEWGVDLNARDTPINVLYYSELDLGSSSYLQALGELGWTASTTFTSSPAVFATLLGSGGWTHVISNHSSTFAAAAFEDALAVFALANPDVPILISDWRINNPRPYLGTLGFAYGVSVDYAGLSPVGDELLDGLPPAPVADPGWGSLYALETAGGTQIATSSLGGGAVQQNGHWFFNGFLGDAIADGSLGSAYVQRELLANTGVRVTEVSPVQHDFDGGTPIVIRGSGFSSELGVTINDAAVTNLTLISSGTMTGTVPPNPVGTYDLVVRDSVTGIIQASLFRGVEYIVGELPPPEDVEAVRVATGVQLTWSNPTFNDAITVTRAGANPVVLPGDATEYLDHWGYPPTHAIEYEITAEAGVRTSMPAVATFVPYREECLPFLAEGASGSAFGDYFALPLESEARLCFHLDNHVNGLGFIVGLRRISRVGKLWARISTVDDPLNFLDTVEFASVPASLSTRTMATSGVALAPGYYVVGIYTTDFEPGVPSFELMPDAYSPHPEPPCPASDYPYAPQLDILPFCENVPPAVTDVIMSRPVDFGVVDPDRLRAGGEGRTTFLRTLTAVAHDDDGMIDHFIWLITYRDVDEVDCDPNAEDPDRWPCSASSSSKGNSILHEFQHEGMWKVTVIAEDDVGDRGLTDRHFLIGVADPNAPCGQGPGIGQPMPATEQEDWPKRYIPAIAETFPAAVATADQEFSALVTPALCSPPPPPDGFVPVQSVQMELIDPDTMSGLGPTEAEKDIDAYFEESDGQRWQASFNMGALPHTDLAQLRVTATGEDAHSRMQPWDVPLCPLPEIFDYDDHPVDLIETTLLFTPGDPPRYDLTATIPDFKILDNTIHVPLVDVNLRNVLDAHATFTEYLEGKWWTPEKLTGEFRATLLDYDLFPTRNFELDLQRARVEISCTDYEIRYSRTGIEIYSSDPWTWEILPRTTLWEGFVGPVHVRVRASLDVGMDINVSADVVVVVRAFQEGGEPVVEIDLVSVPMVNAWATGEIRVEVFWGLASASVRLRPSISIMLPITIHGEAPPLPLDLDVLVDWCLGLALDVNIRGCAFGCISSGWITLFDTEFPDDCGGARMVESRDDGGDPSDLKYPSIATSPDGSTTMTVFVNTCLGAPNEHLPELYYSLDTGTGFSVPEPLYTPADAFTQRDTNVVFLSNTKALAVWTQGTLTHAEELGLPATPQGGNTGFKNQDILCAVWDATTGAWESPQLVTDDTPPNPRIPDGRPVVAPILNNVVNPDAAWVAWVRSDNEDMIYEADVGTNGPVAGDAILSGMSIYARKILTGAPSGGLIKISAGDEAEPAADIQPAVAVSPSGNVAAIVWVRDEDSDFDTALDRYLMYSVWFGGDWSAPQAATFPSVSPGVLMPSLALSSDDDGMLNFTVRDVDTNGEPTAEGNKDIVYAMELRDGVFREPVALKHLPVKNPDIPVIHRADHVIAERPVYGRYPRALYLDASTAVVVYRSFDGFGPRGGDGEIGVATIDLSQPDPKWSHARDVSDNDDRDWDIASVVDPTGTIRTVRDSTTNGVSGFCGLVFEDITCAPDLVVDRIRLSHPHTPPGYLVTLTAVLRNNGLCPSQDTQLHFLHIGRVINDVFEPITDPIPFTFSGVIPDETLTFSHTFLTPVETTHLRAIAEPIQGEMDVSNNSADIVLGVLPPTDLRCTVVDSRPRPTVRLDWENAELYDSLFVYRNGRLLAEVRGGRAAYLDTTVDLGVHEWSVRAGIGRAWSDPEGAVCACTVARRGDFDGDGDVDADDHVVLDDCMAGPDTPPEPALSGVTEQSCLDVFDFDADSDVDLEDFARFQEAFTG